MTGKKHVEEEENEEADLEFKWGNKLEVIDEQNPTSQLYESFVYDGIEYSLFDCVYFGIEPELFVGKLVKIWEQPNHKRMVEVVWLLHPKEIRDSFGDDEPLQNELFLASGEGKGLSNVNVLEAISGKCNVVCTSKDRRNPQPSEVDLSMADFIFSRTFDVGSYRIVDSFPDTIAGIKVEYFFNLSDEGLLYPGIIPSNLNESVETPTRPANIQQPEPVGKTFNCNSYGTRLSPIAEDKKDETQFVRIPSRGKIQSKYKDSSVKDVPKNQPMKKMKILAVSEDLAKQSYGSPSLKLSEKRGTKTPQGKKFGATKRELDTMDFSYQDQKLSKEETTVQKASKSTNKSVEKPTRPVNIQQPEPVGKTFNCYSYGTKLSPIAQDKKDESQFARISSRGKIQSKYNDSSVKDVPKNQPMKKMKNLAVFEDLEKQFYDSPSLKLSEKRGTKTLLGKKFGPIKRKLDTTDFSYRDQKLSGEETTVRKASKSTNEEATRLSEDNNVKTKRNFVEVKRKPYDEKRNWFVQQPWEEKVRRANERGTLILLENLDPSFSSSEVEDLVWNCFGLKAEAKMIQRNSSFGPDYGRALVIFKSQADAEFAISELENRCLMLEDGRIVVGRRSTLKKPEKLVAFVGHLTIPKAKLKQRHEEMGEAKSTAHCSQANTIEYDMAMEWRLLQEQSDKWWNVIHEKYASEVDKLRSKLNTTMERKWK